jgi:hypothetical protein
VSDADPKGYIPKALATHAKEADKILQSNLMPYQEFDYTSQGYDKFIEARSSILHTRVEELCRGEA